MKRIKFSSEQIIAFVVAIIIVCITSIVFIQKNKVETLKRQNEYEENMQQQLMDTTNIYLDSLAILDNEIESLRENLAHASKKEKKHNYTKLDSLIKKANSLIEANKIVLTNFSVEPPTNKYNSDYIANLINALIENISLREKRIAYLIRENEQLKLELDQQKEETKQVKSQRDKAKNESKYLRSKNQEQEKQLKSYRKFSYILGNKKQLKEKGILKRELSFKRKFYTSGELRTDHFKTISIDENQHTVELGRIDGEEVFTIPELSGAAIHIENGNLFLRITDINKLISNGKVVFYF